MHQAASEWGKRQIRHSLTQMKDTKDQRIYLRVIRSSFWRYPSLPASSAWNRCWTSFIVFLSTLPMATSMNVMKSTSHTFPSSLTSKYWRSVNVIWRRRKSFSAFAATRPVMNANTDAITSPNVMTERGINAMLIERPSCVRGHISPNPIVAAVEFQKYNKSEKDHRSTR